jgi:SNF2 family DNA or RNA helicase
MEFRANRRSPPPIHSRGDDGDKREDQLSYIRQKRDLGNHSRPDFLRVSRERPLDSEAESSRQCHSFIGTKRVRTLEEDKEEGREKDNSDSEQPQSLGGGHGTSLDPFVLDSDEDEEIVPVPPPVPQQGLAKKSRAAERALFLEEDIFQINPLEESQATAMKIMMKRSISDHLLSHQKEAVEFMWRNTMQGVLEWHKGLSKTNHDPPTGSGCILAHCMGSGKTLSTLAFIATLLSNPVLQSITLPNSNQRSLISRVLIICPVNVLVNWGVEFQRWVARDCRVNQFTIDANMKRSKRFETLQSWYHRGGVCIMGKELYCNLIEESKKEQTKEPVVDLKPSPFGRVGPGRTPFTVLTFLVSPGPDIVVVDEAHIVKSSSSRLYNILKEIQTKRRISLTGSPLQNNLRELWNMVEFAKSGHLFRFEKFHNLFLRPIEVSSDPFLARSSLTLGRKGGRKMHPNTKSHK